MTPVVGAQPATNGDIAALQRRLADAGCYTGSADGVMSPAVEAAIRACPSQDPVLRIETGMHVASINQIDAVADCRLVVTGSDDKTVRLWSGQDGHLVRTLRPPIGAGPEGKIYATAISPDGRFVAAGGWDAHAHISGEDFVYVFDTSNGDMIARLGGFKDVIRDLVFSPDGRWLAATGATYQGIRVYETATWKLVAADRHYRGDSYGAAFAPDGRLYTVAFDGLLRRYAPGPSFAKEAETPTRVGRFPRSLAIDPSGTMVGIGFVDAARVAVFDTRRLRLRASTPPASNGFLSAIAWSSDGDRLFAAGSYQDPDARERPMTVLAFDRNGRPLTQRFNVADNTITTMKACAAGTFMASQDRGFGLLTASGALSWRATTVADLRDKVGDALTISRDATRVRFGLAYGAANPVIFDLESGTLSDAANAPADLVAATVGSGVDGWQNGFQPSLSRRRFLPLNQGEISRSLASRSDGGGFVIGTSFRLRSYDPSGNQNWETAGPGNAWGVDITPDNKILVVAFGDGTIRWYRMSDGRELLAFFVDLPGRRWIAWTPSGYYLASPGGQDLIGWQINRGWDQPADFFPASRFRERFDRPDVVRLVLQAMDEGLAVQQANTAASRTPKVRAIIADLPPLIRIVGPTSGTHVAGTRVTIDYAWRSPAGRLVDRIDVLIDGHTVKGVGLPSTARTSNAEVKGVVSVDLAHRDSEIGLIAWSGDGASEVARTHLTWDGAPDTTKDDRKLYALVVGVSDYAANDMSLHFAAKDARDFGDMLEKQKGGYYGDVVSRVLTDRAVTRTSIIEGLKWLKSAARSPNDVAVLFLAGHGLTDEQQLYWYLPADATSEDVDTKGVSQDEIRRALESLPGKVLWFLDTCHAGTAAKRPVDVTVLVNRVTAAESGGIVAFASSTGREVSEERPDWNNGAFTKAILEGIALGQADLGHDGQITTSLLDFFLEHRVQALTDGKQHPVMGRPPEEPDFTIARVTQNAH